MTGPCHCERLSPYPAPQSNRTRQPNAPNSSQPPPTQTRQLTKEQSRAGQCQPQTKVKRRSTHNNWTHEQRHQDKRAEIHKKYARARAQVHKCASSQKCTAGKPTSTGARPYAATTQSKHMYTQAQKHTCTTHFTYIQVLSHTHTHTLTRTFTHT